MGEIIKLILTGLVPRPIPGEDPSLLVWRYAVSFTITLIGVILVLYIMFATGLFADFGLSGYAKAVDVQSLMQQNTEARLTQLETRISSDRQLQCYAIMEGNQRAMTFAFEKLQADINEYTRQNKGNPPRIPDCQELIPSVMVNLPAPTPSARTLPTPPSGRR